MAHELRVEGDKVIEQDDKGHVLSTKVSRDSLLNLCLHETDCRVRLDRQDYTHVHSGYLATTHNPRVSQEAKEVRSNFVSSVSLALSCLE